MTARLTVVTVLFSPRTAHLVGIGKCRAQGLAILGEELQPIAAILQSSRHHMNDVLVTLDAAMHHDEPRTHHDFAFPLHHLGPDHRIGDTSLVLQRHEHHALGRAGALAHQHHAANADSGAVAALLKMSTRDNARGGEARAQEAHGVGFEREAKRAVVVHHMLRQGHDGKRYFRFSARLGGIGMFE